MEDWSGAQGDPALTVEDHVAMRCYACPSLHGTAVTRYSVQECEDLFEALMQLRGAWLGFNRFELPSPRQKIAGASHLNPGVLAFGWWRRHGLDGRESKSAASETTVTWTRRSTPSTGSWRPAPEVPSTPAASEPREREAPKRGGAGSALVERLPGGAGGKGARSRSRSRSRSREVALILGLQAGGPDTPPAVPDHGELQARLQSDRPWPS